MKFALMNKKLLNILVKIKIENRKLEKFNYFIICICKFIKKKWLKIEKD